MSTVITIARRELEAYFVSPIAYIVSAAFLVISGYLFSLILIDLHQASLEILFANIIVTLLFITPLLTMRLLADEQRMGTLEVLMTAPVRDWEVVVGKFLAALGLFGVMLLFTLFYPLLIWRFGGNPDPGPLISGYLGLLLMAGAMLAIGTLTSTMTSNQMVAAVLCFGILLMLWLVDAASRVAPSLAGVLTELSLRERYDDFARGAINLEDVVYYLSIVGGALFIATRVLESRRYRV
ncbi:MAG: ABC transporter permease subunit [Chloroflexaceae bacterium]|nr:ABC transporter permease subunit [Chloroflexaceae bacterium]